MEASGNPDLTIDYSAERWLYLEGRGNALRFAYKARSGLYGAGGGGTRKNASRKRGGGCPGRVESRMDEKRETRKPRRATLWLREQLSRGPRRRTALFDLAAKAGIPRSTLYRSLKEEGVQRQVDDMMVLPAAGEQDLPAAREKVRSGVSAYLDKVIGELRAEVGRRRAGGEGKLRLVATRGLACRLLRELTGADEVGLHSDTEASGRICAAHHPAGVHCEHCLMHQPECASCGVADIGGRCSCTEPGSKAPSGAVR